VIRLAVRVGREDAEAALEQLLVFAPGGVEEVDVDAATVEYVLYGAARELPGEAALRAAVGAALVEVSSSEIADDWSERWRAFHRPVTVGERLRVRAPWHEVFAGEGASEGAGGLIDVAIEPGQAFGTGAHATTRGCLELLVGMAGRGEADGPLLDVGCGSGVLAIAAAKLGWAPVYGIDHELESVAASRANAAANGVSVSVEQVDLRSDGLGGFGEVGVLSGTVVVANLVRALLLDLVEVLWEAPAALVCSGLLEGEGEEIAAALAARHAMVEAERVNGVAMDGGAGWLAIRFVRGVRRVSS
jgi:ribosomal protein L11 methyltransferase